MSSAKQLHKIQATTRHNLGDLRQLTQEAHRTAAAVANTNSVAVSAPAASSSGYAQSELDAAARRLDSFFKTAQTAKRDLHQLRELQARLWDDLQLQQRHLEGVRIDADNAEVSLAAARMESHTLWCPCLRRTAQVSNEPRPRSMLSLPVRNHFESVVVVAVP